MNETTLGNEWAAEQVKNRRALARLRLEIEQRERLERELGRILDLLASPTPMDAALPLRSVSEESKRIGASHDLAIRLELVKPRKLFDGSIQTEWWARRHDLEQASTSDTVNGRPTFMVPDPNWNIGIQVYGELSEIVEHHFGPVAPK